MTTQICRNCGDVFDRLGGRAYWCEQCRTTTCKYCGTTTMRCPSRVHRQYCSVECRSAAGVGSRSSTRSAEERFWSYVSKNGQCWEWTGGKSPKGYGLFYDGAKQVPAHRFAYQIASGKIPDGLLVCHHCDNRGCVRPAHLFTGTAKDNMQDAISKGRVGNGRNPRGESCKSSKLSTDAVRRIKASYRAGQKTQTQLGIENNVSQVLISRVICGKAWAHIT